MTHPEPQSAPARTMYSVDEVAAQLGVNPRTIRRAIKLGKLRAFKPCGRVLIAPADVDAWIEASIIESTVERQPPPNLRLLPTKRERTPRASDTIEPGGFRELLRQEGIEP